MQININVRMTNSELALKLKEIKEYASMYYGIESDQVCIDDIINYLNDTKNESFIKQTISE